MFYSRCIGTVTVLAELDREEQPVYTLIIEVWDNYQFGFTAGESRNAFKQIRVELSDVNDQAPVLHLPSTCVTVTEFHDPRDVITLVTADDADDASTPNGRVRFSIAAGNQDGELDGGKFRRCWESNAELLSGI
ncbi:Cadherin-16 [Amphibalanus amphitrite]|uniref:Cadherin-16 n=1 Tax=Amphibalanus amphitrite TaxID=1232801 RepID=A0A6A4W2E8_AMPAM|nr:Cadherin-16 [Amphibalanus amphitrite]